jgi:hypothetical protein
MYPWTDFINLSTHRRNWLPLSQLIEQSLHFLINRRMQVLSLVDGRRHRVMA